VSTTKAQPGKQASRTFISELRRRRALPIAGAYIAIAWLITEIASFLLEQASAPGWSQPLLAIVFVVGFPVTVVLAWVIQVQPGGKWAIDSSKGQHRTVIGAIALGIVATVGLSWLILPRIEDVPQLPDYRPLPNSVAIVPFAGAGATPNERTVGETLYHALLQGLNRSRELTQVQLKTDTAPADLLNFGRRVRVAALLTGSIRSIPGGSRVEMELLDVARNAVRWSHSFEWDPTRIMENGTDIANDVLASMDLPVLNVDRFAGTDSREAYDALLLGFRYQRSFNVEELRIAMDEFQRAIDLDPGYVRAYLGLAQTIFVYLNMKGPPEEERQALTERQRELVDAAYRFDESNAQTHSLMGMLTDNHELKVQMYERALELDPDDGHTYFRLGWARVGEGNLEEAERLFRRALDFRPQSANYRSDLAMVLWQQARHDEAMAELEYSIELDPAMTQNYQKLAAWNMFHYGRIDEAIINFRKAYALDPQAGYLASGVATNYRHLAMKDEAYAWIDHALELSPTASWVWVLAAYVHKSFGDEETAMDDYRRSLELEPSLGIPLRELATMDIRQGRWEDARKRWLKAYPELVSLDDLAIDRGNFQVVSWYAMNLREAGQEEEARQLLDRCLEVISNLPLKSDADAYRAAISDLIDPDPKKILEDLRKQIIDHRQRAELDFYDRQFDLVRDESQFQELVRIVEEDLAMQRERVREMERNGEMPAAPGVDMKF
jgi:tetratricopeptide (TPR) repeat protein